MSGLSGTVRVSRRAGKWHLDIEGLPRWVLTELQEVTNAPGVGLFCGTAGWWGDGQNDHSLQSLVLYERDPEKDRTEICRRVSGRLHQYARMESGNTDHGLSGAEVCRDINELLSLAYRRDSSLASQAEGEK